MTQRISQKKREARDAAAAASSGTQSRVGYSKFTIPTPVSLEIPVKKEQFTLFGKYDNCTIVSSCSHLFYTIHCDECLRIGEKCECVCHSDGRYSEFYDCYAQCSCNEESDDWLIGNADCYGKKDCPCKENVSGYIVLILKYDNTENDVVGTTYRMVVVFARNASLDDLFVCDFTGQDVTEIDIVYDDKDPKNIAECVEESHVNVVEKLRKIFYDDFDFQLRGVMDEKPHGKKPHDKKPHGKKNHGKKNHGKKKVEPLTNEVVGAMTKIYMERMNSMFDKIGKNLIQIMFSSFFKQFNDSLDEKTEIVKRN